jgi:hypothetical protein
MKRTAADVVPDALGRVARLPFAAELPVLGIRTRFETNDATLAALIERTFGVWRAAEDLSAGAAEATVRIVVEPGDEGVARAAALPRRRRRPRHAHDARQRRRRGSPGAARSSPG